MPPNVNRGPHGPHGLHVSIYNLGRFWQIVSPLLLAKGQSANQIIRNKKAPTSVGAFFVFAVSKYRAVSEEMPGRCLAAGCPCCQCGDSPAPLYPTSSAPKQSSRDTNGRAPSRFSFSPTTLDIPARSGLQLEPASEGPTSWACLGLRRLQSTSGSKLRY